MEVKDRIQYYDTLKLIGIICIISLHIFQLWRGGEQILHFDFYALAEFVRMGVPIFLMISGALLLGRDIEIRDFYERKLVRICLPFIFFLILHLIIIRPDSFNVFAYNWYFWMILGVYFSIPIINKFVLHSSFEEIRYILILIVATSIIYQLFYYFGIETFLNLNFFMGPFSYLILGYYFSRREFRISTNRIITIALAVFFGVTLLKMWGVLNIIPHDLVINFNVNQTELVNSWLDGGILELIQASSIFILVKYLYKSETSIYSRFKNVLETKVIKSFIISVSKASYGMYLVNRTLMSLCKNQVSSMHLTGTQMAICFIVLVGAIFFSSWIIVLIFSRIPVIKRFSGYA